MASDWEGLSFSPTGTMFTVSPTWVRIDTGSIFDQGVRVSRIDISRGRQTEFDRVDTGTMTVTMTDRQGVFDPSNTGGPYFAALLRKPVAFAARNPVTDVWWPRFRGVIQAIGYSLMPSQRAGEIVIRCVDWFDYLANFELAPGHGDYGGPGVGASTNASGFVFYEDTDFQTRLVQAAADASIPTGLTSFFTGNVDVQESSYSPGESMLTVFQDACDAEFPSVAQLYVDKTGVLVGHGRYARFTPTSVAASSEAETGHEWDFNEWEAGDGPGVAADSGRAQIRPPFGFSQDVSWIRNAALAYPQGMDRSLMATQATFDNGSIGTYGTRSWSAENLRLLAGTTTGLTAAEECVLFQTYILDNYADPRNRIDQITFKSLHATDPRAAATWALMTRVDISDIVNVQVDHPGGGGFIAEDFFVEGIQETHTPLHLDLDTGWPMTVMTLNLSPQSYYAVAPPT